MKYTVRLFLSFIQGPERILALLPLALVQWGFCMYSAIHGNQCLAIILLISGALTAQSASEDWE